MTVKLPAPVKPAGPDGTGGDKPPPNGNGHHTGWPTEAPEPRFPARRRSFWPFLLDLGLALALFGLIITGRPLVVIGGVIFVVALVGWLRDARADYSRLKD